MNYLVATFFSSRNNEGMIDKFTMLIKLLILIVLQIHLLGLNISYDHFNALQNRIIVNIETPIDVQESFVFGNAILNESRSGLFYDANLLSASYRRYVAEVTDQGIFYSFGFRGGSIFLDDGTRTEQDTTIMPFYDIGLKSKFSDHFYSFIKIEASYVIIYTDNINANHLIGLQITPFFSFGYSF